ncbi:MAG: hypothetical protein KDJ54_03990 [Candidatus Competibacteraceae bacterium]|nr:hypothetical protein [Candidatus Competibacteraceae bacterium]
MELVAQNRIICIDRYLSENEFAAALGAANLVVTPYPDHLASASIVIAAAAAKRPVLGSDKGWIGRIVPFFDLGWTSLVSESRVFGEAIRMALDAAKDYCATEMTRRFVAFHTVQNMRLTWTQRIRERLGIATGTMNCSWDWVVTGHSSSVSMSVPQDLNNKAQTCP